MAATLNAYATISELRSLLKARKVSAKELAEFYLARLERLGPSLGAVVTITRERALTEAAEADRRIARGESGPLLGIPYGVKDLLATKGIPTTWGAEPYRNQVFDFDATVVQRLQKAGAVLCAKLAMVELAGGFGYNNADASFTGPGRSPWNPDFWSGGSSSGPGAAVSAGLVPFAIGSETSGSILTPSSFCGVTGLRPTYGAVSRHGAMALSWTLDKVGPLARSASDCAAVFAAIAGPDPKDPTTIPAPVAPHANTTLRIGLVKGTWEKVQPAVRDNFLASVSALRAMGHSTVELDWPDLPIGATVGTIVDAEGASAFEDIIRDGRAKQLRAVGDRTGGFANAATLAIDYLRAMRIRPKIREALLALFQKADVLVAPTRATVAYPIGPNFDEVYKGVSGGPSLIGGMNLAGAPAVALPNGFGENGLPTSLQIVGAPGHEQRILALAEAVQGKTEWHRKQPPRFA